MKTKTKTERARKANLKRRAASYTAKNGSLHQLAGAVSGIAVFLFIDIIA